MVYRVYITASQVTDSHILWSRSGNPFSGILLRDGYVVTVISNTYSGGSLLSGVMYIDTDLKIYNDDEWSRIAKGFVRSVKLDNILL